MAATADYSAKTTVLLPKTCVGFGPRGAARLISAPVVHDDAVLEVRPQRGEKHNALDAAALPQQVVDRVAVRHALRALFDDRALVEVRGGVVRRRADELDAALVGSMVRLRADEGREERVVDVDHAAREERGKKGAKKQV